MKRILSLVLALMAGLSLTIVPASAADPVCSPWAQYYVRDAATTYHIMPDCLVDCDFRENITRREFCHLAYETMGMMTAGIDYHRDLEAAQAQGTSQEFLKAHGFWYEHRYPPVTPGHAPFRDTRETPILALAQAGIIQGKGNRTFAPEDFITREEAATILGRMADYYDIPRFDQPLLFTDTSAISDWALDGVSAVCGMGIMNGVSTHRFSPSGTYTREQAVATMMRLYYAYPNELEEWKLPENFHHKFNHMRSWLEDDQGNIYLPLDMVWRSYDYRPDWGYETYEPFALGDTILVAARGQDTPEDPYCSHLFDAFTGDRLITGMRGTFWGLTADHQYIITNAISYDADSWGEYFYWVYDFSGQELMSHVTWEDLKAAGYVEAKASVFHTW